MTRKSAFWLFALAIAALAILVGPQAHTAAAQERPRIALELTPGWVGFADDGVVSEGLLAGSARFCLTPRLSVGPEISYISGRYHSHFVLTGNVTFDFLGPSNGRPPRVTPFLVAGAGLFQTREQFFTGPYTSSEGAFTAGGGVKAHVGDNLIVGGEVRIGWEPHLRANGIIGVRF
jgi:hypothetical protein